MGCNCGSQKTAPVTYTHKASDGTVTAYRTETEAKAAVLRRGGSYSKS